MEIPAVFLTTLLSIAILWAEHYSPWERWLGKPLSLPARYTLGVLAMILPLSGLYLFWSWWQPYPGNSLLWALAGLWCDVMGSGLTVLILHQADRVHQAETLANIAERAEEIWRHEQSTPLD